METSWRSCAIWRDIRAQLRGTACKPPSTRLRVVPPPWPAPAAPPAAHCAPSGCGSASAGTAQCAPPAPGLSLSAGGRGKWIECQPGLSPLVPVPQPQVPVHQLTSSSRLVTASMSWYVLVIRTARSVHRTGGEGRKLSLAVPSHRATGGAWSFPAAPSSCAAACSSPHGQALLPLHGDGRWLQQLH